MSTLPEPRRNKPLLTLPLCLAAGVLAGGLVVVSNPKPPAPDYSDCYLALDIAEERLDYALEGLTLSGEALDAAADYDIDGLDVISDEMERLTPKVRDATKRYEKARAKCQPDDAEEA